ncbi:hypothetical protein DE146DRAFT_635780 [Phaeosphaeria sp. MPI-PUGE-AT-0046c]|nr:hypothetical protein DE146DRAFT_635780 [Phaeosphaeria sp. MPI-PUGE-AT-0046c]
MSNPHALIVGCSVAGSTAAYWLSRAAFNVTVIERFPHLRVGGQAVDIRTCGVSVMRKMPGMEARVRQYSTGEQALTIMCDDRQPFGVIRATGNAEQQSLVASLEQGEEEVQILFANGRPAAMYDFVVASLEQGEEQVQIMFANGRPAAMYDFVVACDGATSKDTCHGFR